MKRTLYTGLAAALFLAPAVLYAQNDDEGEIAREPKPMAPLFLSSETLKLEINGPLDELFRMRERVSREWLDGSMTITHADGQVETIPVRLSTRGRFRLQRTTCQFPPIRIRFRNRETAGTLFEGQDRMKIVTHCQDRRDEFEQFVLQEYLIYKIYSMFTPMSFQVRLAQVTWTGDGGRREPITRYAFFIEDDGDMAARNGWDLMEDFPLVPPDDQDPATLSLLEVFQYFVGNPDWSAFQAPPGEQRCCHNVRIIGDFIPPVYPVPYDFDVTGMVNAPYARPDPSLGIRNVRQRVYRGVCSSNEYLEGTLQKFRDQRDAINALIENQEGLDDRRRADMLKYVEEFYDVINDPRQVNRRLTRECRRA